MILSFLVEPKIEAKQKGIIKNSELPKNSEDYDREIIKRINNDDLKAFELLFKTYHASLCNYCYNKVKDKDITKEIVQDVFVNIYKIRKDWSPKGSIKSYLFKAIKNRLVNYIKYSARIQRAEYTLDDFENTNELSPHDLYNQKEFREAYSKAVEKLPEKCREILMLVKDNGFSYRETAEILSVSVKTVESQMRLAFQKLRKKLKKFI